MKILKIQYLILKFFKLISKIYFKLTLNTIYKNFGITKNFLKKSLKLKLSSKIYFSILIIIFILNLIEAKILS